MKTATLKANLEETLYDWFASQSLEIKSIAVERKDDEYERPHLGYAQGEFYPVLFDKEMDGPKIAMLYLLEVAYVDQRFENTTLIFDTDTTFRIV